MIYIYILVALILLSSLYIAIRGDLDRRKQIKEEFEILHYDYLWNEICRVRQESQDKFAKEIDQAIINEIFKKDSKGVPIRPIQL